MGELSGTAVDKDGELLMFVKVLVFDSGDSSEGIIGGTYSDIDGQFIITSLAPGSYDIEFSNDAVGMDTLRLTNVEIHSEQITFLGNIELTQLEMNIIGCDFGMELMPSIKLNPFGGPTIINSEDIRIRY